MRFIAAVADPAETFASSFRLTGRLFRRRPQESRILLAHGMRLLSSDRGLAPRALRDIKAAVAAGRFSVDDAELALALALAGGALLGFSQLLIDNPDRDDAASADRLTADLLRVFGIAGDEADEICSRVLPDIDGPS